jgi:RalA-binding protein 1
MSSSGSNTSTPTSSARDRLPTAHMTPTSGRLTSSASSGSQTTNVTTATSQPASMESLLAAHANAQSPPIAALEQAISERNTLSNQNSQLWKLIEKQRTAYNQILKELDRVRSERDSYKSKFLSLQQRHGEVDKRKDGDREKGLKHSHSTPISMNDHDNTAVNGAPISEQSKQFPFC